MPIGDNAGKVDPVLDKVAAYKFMALLLFVLCQALLFLCCNFFLTVLYRPMCNHFKRWFSSTKVDGY